VTSDKFDPNPILVNINKLKPYRFVEDHTFQPILAKLSDFLLEESVEATHFDNLFIKQPIELTHSDNLLNEELIETNNFGNRFVEKLVQINIRGLTIDNSIERKTNNDLFEPKLVEMGIND
jgi:hypothetical protein